MVVKKSWTLAYLLLIVLDSSRWLEPSAVLVFGVYLKDIFAKRHMRWLNLLTFLILLLQEMGFEEEQSGVLLEKFTTVQAVIDSPEAKGKSYLQYHLCPHRGSTTVTSYQI